jgi:hypothetical protein
MGNLRSGKPALPVIAALNAGPMPDPELQHALHESANGNMATWQR